MVEDIETTDATLTEYLTAAETDTSIDGPAAVDYIKVGHSWRGDAGEMLDDDPAEDRAGGPCGETFGSRGAADRHPREED